MNKKTLGLLSVLASMLVTGCQPSKSDSSNVGGNSNSGTNGQVTHYYENSILNSPVVEARGIPSDWNVEPVRVYRSAFTTDPTTFDYLANNKQTNSEYYANFVDNLLEHDQYGKIRGALAEDAAYFENNTRLRFKLRKGVKWVTNNMNEYADVTADDFATGLQHLLDAKGGAENLAYYIVGAKDYADGIDTNFENVGFHKISDYEFEYILEKPTPFFHTFFEYTTFLPLNRDFFEEMGGVLGEDWDPKECGFGTTTKPQSLLYCGPYVFSAHTKGASLSMVKNTEYWDIGNVQIDKVDYVYNSGTDANSLVEMFENGEMSSLGVNSTNYDLVEEKFGEEYIYEQGTGTTTYYFNWNLNRQTYKVGDCESGKTTDAQKANTRKAILNENFRQAVFSAIPKVELNALQDDEDTALVCIRNTYTTPEFVSIGSSVTTESGVTHPAGSQYYEMVDKEMKAINAKDGNDYGKYKSTYRKGSESSSEKTDANLSTFKDRESSYFNEKTAQEIAAVAKTELEAQGVTFPVHVDYLCYNAADTFLAQAQLLKKRVEKILNENGAFIEIYIQGTSSMTNYETSHFLAPTGADMNFDLSSGTGWGPDYGDPATFLNTLSWEGDLYGNLGFDSKPEDKAIYDEVLGDYQALYEAAHAEISSDATGVDTRYAKFAAAEAELLNSAVIMPNTTDGGGYAISRIIPRTNQRTFFGTDDSRFKYMVLTENALTVDERQEVLDDWSAKYAEYFGEEN